MGVCLTVWLIVTATFLSMRPEHWFLALLIAGLFCFNGITRRVMVALIPFALFGISYDWMNLAHNYEVNPPVDIRGLYEAEKALFGIATAGGVLTPNEYFAIHRSLLMDFLGVSFTCAGCRCPSSLACGSITESSAWSISTLPSCFCLSIS